VGADYQNGQVIREQGAIIIKQLMCQCIDAGYVDLPSTQHASQVSFINDDAAHNTQFVACR
jgi:hypothetical protein